MDDETRRDRAEARMRVSFSIIIQGVWWFSLLYIPFALFGFFEDDARLTVLTLIPLAFAGLFSLGWAIFDRFREIWASKTDGL